MITVPSLLYHDVVPLDHHTTSGFAGPIARRYKLEPAAFAVHLEAIQRRLGSHGHTVLPNEVIAGNMTPGAFLLTFDDGGASSLLIAEMLEARGYRGLFLITTNRIDTPGFVTTADVRELARRGHAIGSHSVSHPAEISRLNDDDLQREWADSCRQLAAVIEEPVTCGSVPGGYFSPRVAAAAEQAGMNILFTSEPTAAWSKCGGLWTPGRYSVVQSTPADQTAALAACDATICRRLATVWQAKKVAKSLLGPGYRLASRLFWQQAMR